MTGRKFNFIIVAIMVCLLIGCSSKTIPDWRRSGFNNLEKFKHSFLSGDDERANLYYEKAIIEIKKSGQLDTLAKAYLTKCAVSIAALEQRECSDFLQIRDLIQDNEIDNYFKLLSGNFESIDGQLLPKHYQAFFKAFTKRSIAAINDAVGEIQSPLSQIIAVGLSIKQGIFNETTIDLAVHVASDQGWKKILLRYLKVMKTLHEENGETVRAEKVQRRINAITINQ